MDKEDMRIFAIVIIVIAFGLFCIGVALGVATGREEYKNELHKQIKENNQLLKENIELNKRLKELLK